MLLIKLAWRNLWRNKRRTAITWASIFFAVILSTLMMSVKNGVYDNMISTTAGDFSGYAQIHAPGYWEEKTIDYSFEVTPELKEELSKEVKVKAYLPRIESFALAASDNVTKGSLVVGVDPDKEDKFNGLKDRVFEGDYIPTEGGGILVGQGLADYLKVGVGDTLVLLGQGYHGTTAAGKYPVSGLVKFGSPELSKQLVFMHLTDAQIMYGTGSLINNLILQVDDGDDGIAAAANLSKSLGEEYEVMDWVELNPDLIQMIESDKVEGYVFMFILYLVISFGIFGTMLMMLAERRHEFGVLVAIGMKRIQLSTLVFIEVMVISVMGAFLGMFGAFPIAYYYWANPIRFAQGEEMAKMYEEFGIEAVLQFSIDPMIFVQQAIVVAIIAVFIAIYPFVKILSVNAIEEMRS